MPRRPGFLQCPALDRPTGGERAILVHVGFGAAPSGRSAARVRRTGGVGGGSKSVTSAWCSGARPEPRFLLGTGKVEELTAQVAANGAEIVLVDHALTPSQERNLERAPAVPGARQEWD
jgi:GTP-binding protein HflX